MGVILLAVSFILFHQSLAGPETGSVRCYVCRSSMFLERPIRYASANCSDINDPTKTAIRYCRACLSYVGDLTPGNASQMRSIHVRTCYDDTVFSVDKKTGIFQTSAVLADDDVNGWAITDGMNKQADVKKHSNPTDFFKYGPGKLSVCNDQDLCNSATRLQGYSMAIWTFLVILLVHAAR